MLVIQNTLFENPSFIQRIMQRKLLPKYNARPVYDTELVSEPIQWNEKDSLYIATEIAAQYACAQKLPKRTKRYNQPKLSHSQSQPNMSHNNTPSLSPSVSTLTDFTIVPEQPVHCTKRKRLSSEIILKIMDKRLLQMQQKQVNTPLTRSVSGSISRKLQQQRLDRVLSSKRRPGTQRSPQMITEYPYVLSQDNEEQDRMVEQHYLLRTAFGSDFCSPLRTQLEKGIVVLDMGCGSGTWSMEMSTAFSNSTFIGMDRANVFPKDIKPRNCHFRTCDSIVQDTCLPFPDNSIDYIYQRDMNWGFDAKTWQSLLQEYQRILKPGGWIELIEPDLETQNGLEKECYMNDRLITGLCLRQQDPYTVHRLPNMLFTNGFNKVETITQSFRLGWEVSQKDSKLECSKISRAMSSQYMNLLKSLKPWLSNVMNLSDEKYDDYITGLPAEWRQAKTFINWHCIVAQKPLYS